MNRKEAYRIVAKAAVSYAKKKRPDTTAGVTICTAAGIYNCITGQRVTIMVKGIFTGLVTGIVKCAGRILLSLDSWERLKFSKEKERKRERFVEYLKEYAEKAVKDK